jgi:O-6-methylguanine DNA methyltransferase
MVAPNSRPSHTSCFAQFGKNQAALTAQLRSEFPRATVVGSRMADSPELDAWIQAFEAHIDGTAPRPDLPLDLRGTAFQIRVWRFLLQVPEGDVISYGELAADIGAPKGVRAAASACAANRIAVLVPCHRVLRGDGGLGGYRWGLERKRVLLDRERAGRQVDQGNRTGLLPDGNRCAVCQREINRRAHRCHLRRIALFSRCPRAVWIDLGGRFEKSGGDARTEAEPLQRVSDDARRYHGRSDDLAFSIRRRNVGDLGHGREHGLLELWLWVFAIVDQVEAIGDFARHVLRAVASGERRAKLGFIGIGGLMQIDMHEHAIAEGCDQTHECRRFLCRAVLSK